MSENLPHYSFPILSRQEASLKLDEEITRFFENLKFKQESDYEKIDLEEQEKELDMEFFLKQQLCVSIPPFRRQIVAPAGMGKTWSVARNLAECKGMIIWYMVPTQRLAREVAKTIKKYISPENVLIYKGRDKENCDRHSLANKLGRKGLSIQDNLCKQEDELCPYFETCPYQQQKQTFADLENPSRDQPPKIIITTHNYLTLGNVLPKPDLVIVDENHRGVFVEITGKQNKKQDEIEPKDLRLHQIIKAGQKNTNGYEGYLKTVKLIASAMREDSTDFLRLLKRENGFDLTSAKEHIREIIKSNKSDLSPQKPDNVLRKMVANSQIPLLERIRKFFTKLEKELEMSRQTAMGISFDPDLETIRLYSLKANVIPKTVPVLIIDASADLEINRIVWGKYLDSVEIRTERNAEVIQVRQLTFSKASLGFSQNRDDKRLTEAADFINGLTEEETIKGIVVIGSLAVEKKLSPLLNKDIKTAHFNNLRGSNEFENCDTVVIIGREEPMPEIIEAEARAFLSDTSQSLFTAPHYVPETRYRRLRNGKAERETVRRHPDNFAQRILEQVREREIEQAIDRLRLIHNEKPKKVFILSSIILDLTVDKSLTWKHLAETTKMHNLIKRSQENGFLPLSGNEIARLHDDLWGTSDAAKSYLKRNGGIKWVEKLIINYKGNDPLNTHLIEYRRKGQRGKPSKAFVFAEKSAIHAVLEGNVGNATQFKIIASYGENKGNNNHD